MQMHPYISALLAAEHVKDMRAQGARGRRARAARRARRGDTTLQSISARTPACITCPA
jgi:hypothetical protein